MSTKAVIKYFLFFCLSYFSLFFLFSTPFIFNKVVDFYRNTAGPFTSLALPKAFVSFDKKYAKIKDANTVQVVYLNKAEWKQKNDDSQKKPQRVRFKSNTILVKEFLLAPFVFLLALVISTPIVWKTKWKSLLFSSLLFYLFVLVRTPLFILFFLSQRKIGIYEYSSSTIELLKIIQLSALPYFATIFIWILTTFRKGNWKDQLATLMSEKQIKA